VAVLFIVWWQFIDLGLRSWCPFFRVWRLLSLIASLLLFLREVRLALP